MPGTTMPAPLSWTNVFQPLGQNLSSQLADALMEYRLNDVAQRRYDDLASRHTEGALTEAEQAELGEFVTLNRMVGILKAEAAIAMRDRGAA